MVLLRRLNTGCGYTLLGHRVREFSYYFDGAIVEYFITRMMHGREFVFVLLQEDHVLLELAGLALYAQDNELKPIHTPSLTS